MSDFQEIGRDLKFSHLDAAYQEYLLLRYNYDNNKRSGLETHKIDQKIIQYITEYKSHNRDFFIEARGFARAKDKYNEVNEARWFYFLLWVKKSIWEYSIKNNWVEDSSSEKEFEEFTKAIPS